MRFVGFPVAHRQDRQAAIERRDRRLLARQQRGVVGEALPLRLRERRVHHRHLRVVARVDRLDAGDSAPREARPGGGVAHGVAGGHQVVEGVVQQRVPPVEVVAELLHELGELLARALVVALALALEALLVQCRRLHSRALQHLRVVARAAAQARVAAGGDEPVAAVAQAREARELHVERVGRGVRAAVAPAVEVVRRQQLLAAHVSGEVQVRVGDRQLFALCDRLDRAELHAVAMEGDEAVRRARVVHVGGGDEQLAALVVVQVHDALRVALQRRHELQHVRLGQARGDRHLAHAARDAPELVDLLVGHRVDVAHQPLDIRKPCAAPDGQRALLRGRGGFAFAFLRLLELQLPRGEHSYHHARPSRVGLALRHLHDLPRALAFERVQRERVLLALLRAVPRNAALLALDLHVAVLLLRDFEARGADRRDEVVAHD